MSSNPVPLLFSISRLSFLLVYSLLVLTTTSATSTQHRLLPDHLHELPSPSTSPFRHWTALGDSYAAGLGCGHPIGPNCARFNLSYPKQLQSSWTALFLPSSTTATSSPSLNLQACSGAFMPGVLNNQIPQLNSHASSSFATLTVSGNDVGFPNLASACIYRFVGWRSGDCAAEIRRTQSLIDGDALRDQFRAILDAAIAQGRRRRGGPSQTLLQQPAFHLFVTGYAALFNEDTTQCNTVSFRRCVAPAPLCWFDTSPTLTRHLRRDLNRLVTNLNARLAEIVHDFNNDDKNNDAQTSHPDPHPHQHNSLNAEAVTFIDYNKAFDGHRFCEAGIGEPDDDPTRSWFYNVDTQDDELSEVSDRQRLERALHPTADGHKMIAKKVAAAVFEHF